MSWLGLGMPSGKEGYDIPFQVEYAGMFCEAGDLVMVMLVVS